MSLLTFTASATQTATTNVTIKPKTIIISFLKSLNCYPKCLNDGAKVRLFAHTAKKMMEKGQKKAISLTRVNYYAYN